MNLKSFLGIIAKKKEIYGLEDEDLAKIIGVSERTFQRRMKKPEEFSLGEFIKIAKFLRFTVEEKQEIMI